jgi:predicted ATPase
MLRYLRIQNFKVWQDTEEIELAPITLFFGANSSGKSSIGQFLMLLKQTIQSQDRKAVINTGGKSTSVELGSFTDMVFQHNEETNILFDYVWDFSDAIKIPNQKKLINALRFKATIGLMDKIPIVREFSYSPGQFKDITSPFKEDITIGVRKKDKGSQYDLTTDNYNVVRRKGRAWPLREPIRFYGFPEEFFSYYQDTNFIRDMQLNHEKLFTYLHYLGPLRSKTERIYSWRGLQPESVGYIGENTISAILSAKNRKFNFENRQVRKPFEAVIANELKYMELINDFEVRPLFEEHQQYEVKVRVNASGSWVDLPDVGFGVSQVLPVLVECFYAPANSIILIEQPEIHLHPKAQSALADVLINVIHSRENGKNRNIQLIIETHSEHFLRRLQRRIAEKRITESDVKGYFAKNNSSYSKLEQLHIDEYGNITNWPENFFGDEIGDIAAHTKAMMQRKLENE